MANADAIKGAEMDGVEPSFDAIADGDYPVSRSLFFYIKQAHVGVVPGIMEAIVSLGGALLVCLALNKLGAIWIPVCTDYRGDWLLDTLLRVGFDYGRVHLPDFILRRKAELGV